MCRSLPVGQTARQPGRQTGQQQAQELKQEAWTDSGEKVSPADVDQSGVLD